VQPWLASNSVDAIILDVMLPGKDGMMLCKEIRRQSDIPILMVTARVEEIDRLLGLELGADDYICKPFSPREVVARVQTVLRRVHAVPKTTPLLLDEQRLLLQCDNQQITLTTVECQLLKPMMAEPGRIYSRQQLMDNMYQDNRIVSDRTIDSHIKKLRKKLNDAQITSVVIQSAYGAGYSVQVNASSSA
jgi:two-component system response regulator BaeR